MKKRTMINFLWKPIFAAVMTGILSKSTSFDPIVIGLLFGAAASVACFFDIKRFLKGEEKK